ncbi:MAG TPA: hypothetical protein VMY18_10765, partial [Acidobacteriota bacterium]|nr:hypothetical protein [Acidobacteriota bacterium]
TIFSVLPFIFIPHYAGFFWYLPMVGWSVLGAGLIILVRDAGVALVRIATPRSNLSAGKVRNCCTLLVVLPVIILLAVQHTRLSARTLTHFMNAQAPVSALVNSFREIRLEVSNLEEVQVIVIDDPYRPDFHTPTLLAQLLFDASVPRVMRISRAQFEVMEFSETNRVVLRFDGERFKTVEF